MKWGKVAGLRDALLKHGASGILKSWACENIDEACSGQDEN